MIGCEMGSLAAGVYTLAKAFPVENFQHGHGAINNL